MQDELISQIQSDVDAFYDSLLSKLENIEENVQIIIQMMEALRAAECFDELADLVEEVFEEGQTYKLFHAIIEYLPHNKDLVEELVALVCERDLISPEDLERISTWDELIWSYDSDDYNRSKCGMATAACNTRTQPDVLAKIAMNCSGEIACRITANPRTPWDTLFYLARKATSDAGSFGKFTIPSVILPIFMRADITEAKIHELRLLIENHEVIELVDKFLANRNDPEIRRYLL
jgi:hypothetical protein